MPTSLLPILQTLRQVEGTSLFRYILNSPPYFAFGMNANQTLIDQITVSTDSRVSTLEEEIENLGETPAPLHFPMHFAALHFVSLDYLLPRLRIDKRAAADAYSHAVAMLSTLPDSIQSTPAAERITEFAAENQSELAALDPPSQSFINPSPF